MFTIDARPYPNKNQVYINKLYRILIFSFTDGNCTQLWKYHCLLFVTITLGILLIIISITAYQTADMPVYLNYNC